MIASMYAGWIAQYDVFTFWPIISENPAAIDVLEANPDNTHWKWKVRSNWLNSASEDHMQFSKIDTIPVEITDLFL